MKRRDFIKSAAIATSAVAAQPLFTSSVFAQTSKSKVVIATDPQCLTGTTADTARVQAMVDHTIMALTGKNDKAAAYEALFPKPVTSATTILIKSNEGTGAQASLISYPAVKNAVKAGLRSMLSGAFPAANIRDFNRNDTAAASNPAFTLGGGTYRVKDMFMSSDYFINIPVCWATTAAMAGVTMSLKSMMGSVSGTLSTFHSYFTNATTPALSLLNSQQVFKDKLVLVLMDAIQINYTNGPTTAANGAAYSLVASQKDPVAVDYQGMLILKGKGLSADRETAAKTVFDNAARSPYSIGVSDPNNMDVVNISAPWSTSVSWRGRIVEDLGIGVDITRKNGRPNVVFTVADRSAGATELSVFTIDGSRIWVTDGLEWNGETVNNRTAGPGTYLYSLKAGGRVLLGQIAVGF
jgi:uncharacterized protein (DUF362 family)